MRPNYRQLQLANRFRTLYYDFMQEAGINTNLPVKWIHYFVDKDQNKLIKLFKKLKDHGYLLESLDEINNKCRLKVSKIDIISTENDLQKGLRLYQLTNYLDIESYDCRIPARFEKIVYK